MPMILVRGFMIAGWEGFLTQINIPMLLVIKVHMYSLAVVQSDL